MPDTTTIADKTLQALLDTVQTFIGILSTDGSLSYCNRRPLVLANLKSEDVYGKYFWNCPWFERNPETQTLIQNAVARAAAGETINCEFQMSLIETPVWVNFTLQPVIEAGEVLNLAVEGHDITEKKQLFEETQTARHRLQALFDGMKTMVAILDISGRVTLVNNTPLLANAMHRDDVVGRPLWDCAWFNGNNEVQRTLHENIAAAAAGQSVRNDIQSITTEGLIWLELNIHPVFDDRGKVVQLVAEANNPSSRRQVEEEREQALLELQERERNLAITLDSIGDAVIATDAQGHVTRMNPVAEQLTGWTFTEAKNQTLERIFPIFNATTNEPPGSPIDQLIATGNTVQLSNHTTLRARDGSEYQVSSSAAPIRDNDDKILGAILVFRDISEQYRLREQAASIQKQLQSLFDDMQTMVGLYSPEGTTTFLNNTPLLITGYTQEETIGKKLWDTPFFNYSEKSKAHVRREMRRAAAGSNTLSDIEVMSTSGKKLWITLSFHPVTNDQGQVVQILGEARDITKRKTIENNLRASERQLKRYRDQAPLAAIEIDNKQRVVGWNIAAEKMFGYSYEQVINENLEFILPDTLSRENITRAIKSLNDTKTGETFISEFQHKDGHTFYAQSHNVPFIDESGHTFGAGAIIRDVTDELAAQKNLRDSEKTQREILDSMVEGVIVSDENGTILSFNRAAENLLGYSAEEIAGQSVFLLVDEKALETIKHNWKRYLSTGDLQEIDTTQEIRVICKNGSEFPTLLAVGELSKDSDEKRRFIISFRDLSALKRQEEQLRRSQKMDSLGKLTGGIAHDFNNMLGIVTGYSDLLINALSTQEKLAQYAHEIHRAGERGAKLTRKLLSFSQQTAVSASRVDINSLISNQRHMLETSLTPRIKLVYELAENAWPICIDSDDLEDAIINISINAMHAIDSNGQITLHTQNIQLNTANARLKNLPSGDYVLLSITDTGRGMDDATQQKIFDPFYTTKGDKGTGLGLSQVYSFVERSRGAIEVTSMPGRGTQLRLYFPRYNADCTKEPSDSLPPPMSLGGNETILVVEDEEKLLSLCTEILSAEGYQVLPAHNCKEALALLESNHVDLMFSDVVMPDMDGYELAQIVSEKYPTIKIQMASGFSDDRQSALADDTLHHDLLLKPYRAQTLLHKIRGLLDA